VGGIFINQRAEWGAHRTVTGTTLRRVAERVSLQEAAHRLGVSVRTLQRRIRTGEIAAERIPTPRGYRVIVLLDAGTAESEPASTPRESDATAVLAEVRAQRDWLQARVEALERTVDRLTVLLNQAQQLAQLPQRGNDRDDMSPADDTPTTRQADTPDRPTEMPRSGPETAEKPPPRPWWRRWFGG
jgi:excisionase family DNA binding protein